MESLEELRGKRSPDCVGETVAVNASDTSVDQPSTASEEIATGSVFLPAIFISELLELKKGEQLALIPCYSSMVSATLKSGEAEVFGLDLVPEIRQEFRYPQRAVIASYSGCTLLVEAVSSREEILRIPDDPFPMLVGCMHAVLEEQRSQAKASCGKSIGPKVLVVGPMDTAKSSCCRTLLNYALSAGWNPTFVDLDAGQQGLALPGIISTGVLVERVQADGSMYDTLCRYDLPLGKIRLDEDQQLYKDQAQNLAHHVLQKLSESEHFAASGVIINTAGWIDENGFAALTHIARVFQVSTVIALDNAKLGQRFQQWSRENNLQVEILYAKKPVSLVERSIEARHDYRDYVVKKAFCGLTDTLPTCTVPLDQLIFYQLASFQTTSMKRVLAISCAPNLEVDVKWFPVRGYVVL